MNTTWFVSSLPRYQKRATVSRLIPQGPSPHLTTTGSSSSWDKSATAGRPTVAWQPTARTSPGKPPSWHRVLVLFLPHQLGWTCVNNRTLQQCQCVISKARSLKRAASVLLTLDPPWGTEASSCDLGTLSLGRVQHREEFEPPANSPMREPSWRKLLGRGQVLRWLWLWSVSWLHPHEPETPLNFSLESTGAESSQRSIAWTH